MKKSSSTKSFDIDGLHLTLRKNLDTKAPFFSAECFQCLLGISCVAMDGVTSRFHTQTKKERYDECSSYRPPSVSSHIGKTQERILAFKFKSHLDVNGLLVYKQEGFRSKRNTTRSLYRLHLMHENAKRSRLTTALLNIDLENAFKSVGWTAFSLNC